MITLEEDMEVIATSRNQIARLLSTMSKKTIRCKENKLDHNSNYLQPTQTLILANAERDRHIDKILQQQSDIKKLIEKDGQIKSLRKTNAATRSMIENLREQCASIAISSVELRERLIGDQQKEIERYKVEVAKGIAEEVRRHAKLLQNKEKDCEEMRTAIKVEEEGREEHIRKFTEDLETQLEKRKSANLGNKNRPAQRTNNPFDEEDDELQLCTIDEFQPYGQSTSKQRKRH